MKTEKAQKVILALAVAACALSSFAINIRVAFPKAEGINNREVATIQGKEVTTYSGFNYDYIQKIIAETMNFTCEYVGYDEKRMEDAPDMVANKEADIALFIPKDIPNPERFRFSRDAIACNCFVIRTKVGNKKFMPNDVRSWHSIRVAVPNRPRFAEAASDMVKLYGIDAVAVTYKDKDEAYAAMERGETDAVLDYMMSPARNTYSLALFKEFLLYAITRKDDKTIMDEFNLANDRIYNDDPGFLLDVKKKYFGHDKDGRVMMMPDENKYLRSLADNKLVLWVAVCPDRPPISYIDENTGKFAGILVDACELIFKRAGMEYRLVECKSRQEYNKVISEGQYDIMLDGWDDRNYAESKNIRISEPYCPTTISFLHHVDRPLTKNSRVGLIDSVQFLAAYINYTDKYVVNVSSMDDAIAKINSGVIDGVYLDSSLARWYAASDESQTLSVTPVSWRPIGYSFAAHAYLNPYVIRILNRAISNLGEDEISNIKSKYDVPERVVSWQSMMKKHSTAIVSVLLFFMLLIFALAVLLILRKMRTNEKLTYLLKQVTAAEKAKSSFLSTMSHEIRTPLNAIIGYSDLLDSNKSISKSESEEYIHSIVVAGKFLLSLINDILDITKMESENMQIHKVCVNITKLIDDIVPLFKKTLADKGVGFSTNVSPNMPLLELDGIRVRQILFNLIGNATKFTDKGGVTVSCWFDDNGADAGILEIVVHDTGCGIPKDKLSLIFDPFVQVDEVRDSRKFGGTGLGLAISTRLAALMGGTLSVDSDIGRGSTFTLRLANVKISKRVETRPKAPLEANPAIYKSVGLSVSRKKVLVVDDIQMNLKVTSAIVERCGCKCLTAQSGAEALQILERENITLILSDLWMPQMSGEELARAVHADSRFKNIPIVAITADVEASNKHLEESFSSFIFKPITIEAIREIIEKYT